MDIEKYISLKDKQRHGNLSKDEQQALRQWSLSAEGKLLLQIDQLTDTYKSGFEPNVEAGLARLKMRIQQAEAMPTPAQPLRVAARRRWWSVAAAVLILVVAGVVLRGLFQSPPDLLAIETTVDENKNLTLTDGTKVQLNAASKLFLPESFDNQDTRTVQLTGEAYFDVAANAEQPFRIEAEEVLITVVGTEFNVRAYPQETTVEVEVEEGAVRMRVAAQEIVLAANEKGVYDSRTQQLYKKAAPQLNAQAWRTHRLKFANAPLTDIFQELARYHRVQIEVKNETLKRCSHTCNFQKTKLEDALSALQLALNFEMEEVSPRHFIIRNGACK